MFCAKAVGYSASREEEEAAFCHFCLSRSRVSENTRGVFSFKVIYLAEPDERERLNRVSLAR